MMNAGRSVYKKAMKLLVQGPFLCLTVYRLLPFKARNGGIRTLSASQVSILYYFGAAVFPVEIEKQAEKLTVSRQSVSKWEMDQSLPEIDKIILMSRLFSVGTDENL